MPDSIQRKLFLSFLHSDSNIYLYQRKEGGMMQEASFRTIIEATMGKKTEEEWKFCMKMVDKVLQHDSQNGVKHTEYGLLELVRQYMKKTEKECLQ